MEAAAGKVDANAASVAEAVVAAAADGCVG